MIDRVAARLGRPLVEVPVGFKWFVDGLLDGSLGFGGEESAGASFLRRDGTVWTTDKDGIVLGLLAAEMTAVTGRDPGELYRELTREFGEPVYERIDAPATPAQKAILAKLSPEQVTASELAGETITSLLTKAPGNDAPIGGLKVVTAERMVRRPPLRNGGRLQALRGELQGPRPPAPDPGRGAGGGPESLPGGRRRLSDRATAAPPRDGARDAPRDAPPSPASWRSSQRRP